LKAEILANGATDYDGREAVIVTMRFRFLHHFTMAPPPHQPGRALRSDRLELGYADVVVQALGCAKRPFECPQAAFDEAGQRKDFRATVTVFRLINIAK
jgi:hypothetical protein